jgi:hypothetical protein
MGLGHVFVLWSLYIPVWCLLWCKRKKKEYDFEIVLNSVAEQDDFQPAER